MQLKDLLKIVGAGITGGYLALKIRRSSRNHGEFLQISGAVAIEFRHQLETVLLQTMLPAVDRQDRDELCRLMDEQAGFIEQMLFFQAHLEEFDELIVQAVERLYRLKAEGSIAPTTRRHLSSDPESYRMSVDEVFLNLEECFLEAIQARLPKEDESLLTRDRRTIPQLLRDCVEFSPDLGSIFFEGYERFEQRLTGL